jgi:PAS domain S-box-containing protein
VYAVLAAAAGLGAQTTLTYPDFMAVVAPLDEMRLRGATGVAYLTPGEGGAPATRFHRALVASGAPPSLGEVARYPEASTALERARAGTPVAASEPFRRTGSAEGQPLYFVVTTTVPAAPGAERAGFRGWLALEIRGSQFVGEALRAPSHDALDLAVYTPDRGSTQLVSARWHAGTAEVSRAMPVTVADRRWQLRVQARRADLPGGDSDVDTIVAVSTAVVTLLLTAFVLSVLTGRDRAEARVRKATAELTEAEREARRHSALLTTVMESIGDGVAVISERGDFLMYNPAALDLFGPVDALDRPADLAVSRPDGTPFPSEEWPLVRAVEGQACDNVEMVVADRSGGTDVWLNVSARPLTPETGRRGAVAVFHDITALRGLNEELEQRVRDRTGELAAQAERLREANAELEAFSYSVSHDLRAPLRTVDGFARMLTLDNGGTLDERGQRYLEKIRSGAQTMGQLIDGLLSFSRLQRQPMARTRIDMARLTHAVWEDLAAERGERTVRLRVDGLPPATGDPRLVRQVLANLLGNAIKYSAAREDARVTVHGSAEGQLAEYAIQDNGVGFDMRYADKLFQVFQRLHRREDYEGTGIGLALAARIVHRHGGRIWADAEPGVGATFHFTLPRGEG